MDAPAAPFLLDSFIEAIARLTSYALTDQEKETVVRGFRQFHQRLERISSSASLRHLAIESQRKKQPVACQHTGKTCTQNCTRGFAKAFLVGYAVKSALDMVPHILSLRLFSRPGLLVRSLRSRDTLSFAAFLSAVIGSYKGGLCLMRRYHGGSDYVNSMVAGALAGLVSIKLDRNRSRRAAVTLYMVSRALQYGAVWLFNLWATHVQDEEDQLRGRSLKRAHSAVSVGHQEPAGAGKPRFGRLQAMSPPDSPVPARVQWAADTVDTSREAKRKMQGIQRRKQAMRWIRACAPTALMSASVGVIVYVLFFHTDVLPRGYLSFLSRASGYELLYPKRAASALKSVGSEVLHGTTGGRIPKGMTTKEYIARLPLAKDLLPAAMDGIRHDYVACGIFHPHTTSCTRGALATILQSLPVAMKVYAPLNASVLLLFKRRQLLANPRRALAKLAVSSLRSSLFFALMVAYIINGSCSVRAVLGRDTFIGYILTGLAGGLAVLVEQPSRRIELAMYCFLRAVENAWDVGVRRGLWRNVRHAEVALFSAAMGVLMTIYQNDPSTISLTYHSILTRVFGKN
ncbi:hypothetical protein LPJ53_005898 [Coemansia erecta]|uniref:Transmembrane protein 135 N-terminal domain-containing protein n=1 Tax=Coemansia erecta TaxID=147472 RepID=A0A9W8CMN5_9FUNG|nr:hypothetical protein LPJ53_005898 [Coemansia erecta]